MYYLARSNRNGVGARFGKASIQFTTFSSQKNTMSPTLIWAIISGFGSAILTYLITYTNAKAKFRAEIETISQKTEKQEKVITKYKLEVAQKSHQYEKKHNVYSKYHNLLDRFEQ